MEIRVGGRYRYKVGEYIVNTYFRIESFDGTKFIGRSDNWCEAIWYFNASGEQIGTELSPDSGASSVRLVLEDR